MKPPFAFIHIPRTAGTSFRRAIIDRLGKSKTLVVKTYEPNDLASLEISPSVRMIMGHMSYGLHEHLPVRYVTILREPVSRVVSQYRMHLLQRNSRALDVIPFDRFVTKKRAKDLQCRLISGLWYETDDATLLETAKQNLFSFEHVGFFDNLEGFASHFGIQSMPMSNKTEKSDQYDLDLVAENNKLDQQLYGAALARYKVFAAA